MSKPKMCTCCKERPAVWKHKNTKKNPAPKKLAYICDYCLNDQPKSSELIDLMDEIKKR